MWCTSRDYENYEEKQHSHLDDVEESAYLCEVLQSWEYQSNNEENFLNPAKCVLSKSKFYF